MRGVWRGRRRVGAFFAAAAGAAGVAFVAVCLAPAAAPAAVPATAAAAGAGTGVVVAARPSVVASQPGSAAGNGAHALAFTFRSGRWAFALPPVPAATTSSTLDTISCLSATRCLAGGTYNVGTRYGGALLERLRFNGWHHVPVPALTRAGASWPLQRLSSLTCASVSDCVALTGANDPAQPRNVGVTLTGAFNGPWTVQRVPVPPDAAAVANPTFGHLSCPVAGFCAATEQYQTATDAGSTMLLQRAGRWTVSTPQDPAHYRSSTPITTRVSAMTCTSAGHCVAVGYFPVAHRGDRVFAETLTGRTWSARLLPLPGGRRVSDALLSTLACTPDESQCVAGGYWSPKPTEWTTDSLIEVINPAGHALAHSGPNLAPSWASRAADAAACPADGRCLVMGRAEKRGFVQAVPAPRRQVPTAYRS